MGTTTLKQYQKALIFLGEPILGSSGLSEDVKPRRVFDQIYSETIDEILSEAAWNFGTRSVQISNDEAEEPLFGYAYSFSVPSDLVRIVSISDVGYFTAPGGLEWDGYKREGDHWFADASEIYLRYVSNDSSYGGDLTLWTAMFARAHAALLAWQSGLPVTGDERTRDDIYSLYRVSLGRAKNLDAIESPPQTKAEGSWVRARRGRGMRRMHSKEEFS